MAAGPETHYFQENIGRSFCSPGTTIKAITMNTPGLTLSPGQGGAERSLTVLPTNTLPLGSNSGASLINLPEPRLAPQGFEAPALFSEGT
jgi:hypothetical protein